MSKLGVCGLSSNKEVAMVMVPLHSNKILMKKASCFYLELISCLLNNSNNFLDCGYANNNLNLSLKKSVLLYF